MSKREALIALWRLLVELFGDKAQASRLAEQSGVDPARVSADGSAAEYWWRVLVAAHSRGKVQEIVKNAGWEMEERASDLKQAWRTYADAPDTGEALDAPTITGMPGQIGGITIGKIEAANVGETQFIDQRNATLHIGGSKQIDTGGGAYVGGNVNTRGGDFVGHDKTTAGVAIGAGASAQVGLSAAALAQALAPIVAAVQTSVADPAVQAVAMQEIEKLQAELARGTDADDARIAGILDGLANLPPGAVAALVRAFGAPLLAGSAGPVTQFVLGQFRGR